MKTQQMKLKRKTLALALALAFAAGPAVANAAATVDDINGTQTYQYADPAGNPYTLYDFTGTSSPNILQFGSASGYGPLINESVTIPGVETTENSTTVANGGIEWQAGGQPTNRLAIVSTNPVPGNGVLNVTTDPLSGSNPENYLNLILAGNQSVGASSLIFYGWGRVAFGSQSAGVGDTQSLSQFQATSDFSGVLNFYNASVSVNNVVLSGNGIFQSKGGVNTVNLGAVYSPGTIIFGSALGKTTFNMSVLPAAGAAGVTATGVTINGTTTFNMAAGPINLGGGTALLEADENFGEVGVNGNLNLVGGNLTVSPSSLGLEITGNYFQNGGNLILDITPSGGRGLVGTGGTYRVIGGNVIVNGEVGNYKNGQGYTLLESTNVGGNTYAPANTYYVYNNAKSATIDGLNPHLKTTATQVDLCLGSACVAQPAPAKSTPTPAKSTPAQPQPQHVMPVIPVHVVTPTQETKPVVADAPSVTQAAIQNTSQALVSTGVVGGGPRGLWAKGMGGFSDQDGYAGTNYGLIAGYGKSVGPDNRDVAGVAFSAGQAGLGTGVNDFTKASDYGLWMYGTYYPTASRQWKITGTLGGGMSTNTLMSTSLGLPQTAHFGGSFVGTEVRASYWRTLDGGVIVSPRLSVGYDQSWTGGYTTHGGGPLDVNVGGQSDGQLYFSPAILVGKKFNYHSQSGNHTIFPQLRVGMVENIGPNPAADISSGQVAGQVQGLAYPHLQGMAEVRLDVISHTKFSKGLSVNVSARELFGGGASSMEGIASIKYHW